jgi:preprotein translocase subunit YajC
MPSAATFPVLLTDHASAGTAALPFAAMPIAGLPFAGVALPLVCFFSGGFSCRSEQRLAPPPPPPPPPPGPAGTPGTPGTQQPMPSGQPQQPCGGPEMFLYLPVFLLLMYFMVMRPEQKRRKEQQNLLSSVKQGDRVVTIGGMHGVITKLSEKTVTLRADDVQMTFDRTAIARVERGETPAADSKD